MSEEVPELTVPPRVSVGLPVLNGADYIEETLKSILGQTYRDFELIICDNASTDGTIEICEGFAAKDPRVRLHRHPKNLGAQVNYDTALALSTGEYFKWAAHDDPFAPTFLEKCVEVLDDDPGCVLVHPSTVLIDAYGVETGCYIDLIALDSEDPAARLARWLNPPNGFCNPVFGLMRRDVVNTTGLHGDFASSDRVFLGEMAMRGRCRRIPEGLFLRRIHPQNSVVANRDARDLAAWFKGKRPVIAFPRFRLFRGFLESVNRAPLNSRDRIRCYRVVLNWAWVMRHPLFKELMIPLHMNGQDTRLGIWVKRRRYDLRNFPNTARRTAKRFRRAFKEKRRALKRKIFPKKSRS